MLIEIIILTISFVFSTLITGLFPIGYGLHYWIPLVFLIPGYLVGVALMWITLSIFAAPFSKKKIYDKPSSWALFWLQEALKYIDIHAGVDLHIEGEVPFPVEKFMIISNHRSKFDPMILAALYGKKHKLAFISKPTNFKIPVGGRFMAGSCYLAIDRYDKIKSLETINKAIKLIKEDKSSIGVFPEGTRSENNEMGPFHEGVFSIAKHTNAPIIITSFMGTENIHKNFPFKRTKVTLKIIEILYPENYQDMIVKEISDYCYEKMKASLTDIKA